MWKTTLYFEELENDPFPQIRGERLERLFFSASDRIKSCNVCNRRKRTHADKVVVEQARYGYQV